MISLAQSSFIPAHRLANVVVEIDDNRARSRARVAVDTDSRARKRIVSKPTKSDQKQADKSSVAA
jgi:hypothetical protein